jgi:hypothetical protein
VKQKFNVSGIASIEKLALLYYEHLYIDKSFCSIYTLNGGDFLEKTKWKRQKMIPRRDFIYLCIILTIAAIALVTIVLGDSTRAGENLNFAATLSSIILAVLAIVITLVDSSGQKEIISQLQDASEEINDSVENVRSTLSNTREQLSEVLKLKDELLEQSRLNMKEIKDEFINEIKKQAKGESGEKITVETLKEILDQLEEKNARMFENSFQSLSIDKIFGLDSEIERHLDKRFNYCDFSEEDLIDELYSLCINRNYNIPNQWGFKVKAKQKINQLLMNSKIYEKYTDEGKRVYFTLPF